MPKLFRNIKQYLTCVIKRLTKNVSTKCASNAEATPCNTTAKLAVTPVTPLPVRVSVSVSVPVVHSVCSAARQVCVVTVQQHQIAYIVPQIEYIAPASVESETETKIEERLAWMSNDCSMTDLVELDNDSSFKAPTSSFFGSMLSAFSLDVVSESTDSTSISNYMEQSELEISCSIVCHTEEAPLMQVKTLPNTKKASLYSYTHDSAISLGDGKLENKSSSRTLFHSSKSDATLAHRVMKNSSSSSCILDCLQQSHEQLHLISTF